MKAEAWHRARIGVLASAGALATAGFLVLADGYLEGDSIVDLDMRVEHRVVADMPAWAEWVARPLTWIGGLAGVILVVGIAVVALVRAGRPADALLLLGVAAGVQVVILLLKNHYERPRPDAGSPIELPHSYAFPSGHAATGIAVGGALAVLLAERMRSMVARSGVLAAGLLIGVAIGASRVVLNVHYLSDVLAGYCVGFAWLCACLLVRELLPGRAK